MLGALYSLNTDLLNVKCKVLYKADKETLLGNNQFPALRNSMICPMFFLSSAPCHMKMRLILLVIKVGFGF